MKLLLDENLSDRIVNRIVDLYPNSRHVKTLALTNTDDAIIWEYAKANDFAIVSKDADFHQRSLVYGHPPKVIYLRIGNSPTSKIVKALRVNFDIIVNRVSGKSTCSQLVDENEARLAFAETSSAGFLAELYNGREGLCVSILSDKFACDNA